MKRPSYLRPQSAVPLSATDPRSQSAGLLGLLPLVGARRRRQQQLRARLARVGAGLDIEPARTTYRQG